MRRCLLILGLAIFTAGCGGGDGDAGSSGETDPPPVGEGFVGLGALIPEVAVGDDPLLVFEDVAAIREAGFEIPTEGEQDQADVITDLYWALRVGHGWDGLGCERCGFDDDYAASFRDAMGYAPGAPDRVVVVGRGDGALALLDGGIDPDELASAFEGDDTYTVERDGDEVRISSSCEVAEFGCVEGRPSDELGRGLHLWSDGRVTAISFDPRPVDATAAVASSGEGALAAGDPLMAVLAAADDLALLVGAGGPPLDPDPWMEFCSDGVAAAGDAPEVTSSLLGVRAADPRSAELVVSVDVADESDATAAAGLLDEALAGDRCTVRGTTPTPYAEHFDVAPADVDGVTVTVSAEVLRTFTRATDGVEAPRGALWNEIWFRQDLPYATSIR
jgi:hypothetical protein